MQDSSIFKYSVEEVFSLSKRFIAQKFSYCHAAFLTGSSVDGNFNPESDIDIGIVSQLNDYIHIEMVEFEGRKVQIIILPLTHISNILWQDYMNRKAPYLSMLSKGLIIKDTGNFLEKTIANTKVLFNAPAPPISRKQLQSNKNNIISVLSDIKGAASNIDKILFQLQELLHNLCSLMLESKQIWYISNRQLLADTKKYFPKFYDDLHLAHNHFYQTHDPSRLIEFIEISVSNLIGEISPFYTHYVGLYHVSHSYLVVHIIDNIYEQDNVLLKKLTRFLKVPYIYFRSGLFNGNVEKEGIYMMLMGDCDRVSSMLLQYVKSEKILFGREIQFPINYDVEFAISSCKAFNTCALKTLSLFSKYCIHEKINDSNGLIYAMLLFRVGVFQSLSLTIVTKKSICFTVTAFTIGFLLHTTTEKFGGSSSCYIRRKKRYTFLKSSTRK